jgi:hypothetical protein
MRLGRRHEKRVSPLPCVEARHRTSQRQSFRRLCELAGAGSADPKPDAVSRDPSGRLRRGGRWAAARLRATAGVAGFDLEGDHRPDQHTPWLGLLVWALAGVGLVVSLLLRADDLDSASALAARDAAAGHATGALDPAASVGQSRLWQTGYPPPR